MSQFTRAPDGKGRRWDVSYSQNDLNQYCYCSSNRLGSPRDGTMVMCDHCNDWFHPQCTDTAKGHIRFDISYGFKCRQCNHGSTDEYSPENIPNKMLVLIAMTHLLVNPPNNWEFGPESSEWDLPPRAFPRDAGPDAANEFRAPLFASSDVIDWLKANWKTVGRGHDGPVKNPSMYSQMSTGTGKFFVHYSKMWGLLRPNHMWWLKRDPDNADDAYQQSMISEAREKYPVGTHVKKRERDPSAKPKKEKQHKVHIVDDATILDTLEHPEKRLKNRHKHKHHHGNDPAKQKRLAEYLGLMKEWENASKSGPGATSAADPAFDVEKAHRCIYEDWVPMVLWSKDSAPGVVISKDGREMKAEKGYRTSRASYGVFRGAWYFEVKFIGDGPKVDDASLPKSDDLRTAPTGEPNLRVGISTEMGRLHAPVGSDKFSYSYRAVGGDAFHEGKRHVYGRQWGVGDTVGVLVALGEPEEEDRVEPWRAAECRYFFSGLQHNDDYRSWIRSPSDTDVIKNSSVTFYVNGVSQGTIFRNIHTGCYKPAVSSYCGAMARVNFGPEFDYPPPMPVNCFEGVVEEEKVEEKKEEKKEEKETSLKPIVYNVGRKVVTDYSPFCLAEIPKETYDKLKPAEVALGVSGEGVSSVVPVVGSGEGVAQAVPMEE